MRRREGGREGVGERDREREGANFEFHAINVSYFYILLQIELPRCRFEEYQAFTDLNSDLSVTMEVPDGDWAVWLNAPKGGVQGAFFIGGISTLVHARTWDMLPLPCSLVSSSSAPLIKAHSPSVRVGHVPVQLVHRLHLPASDGVRVVAAGVRVHGSAQHGAKEGHHGRAVGQVERLGAVAQARVLHHRVGGARHSHLRDGMKRVAKGR